MTDEKALQEAVTIMRDFAHKTDRLNKRLVIALVIAVLGVSICFSAVIISMTRTYFTTDYGYPDVVQQQQQQQQQN